MRQIGRFMRLRSTTAVAAVMVAAAVVVATSAQATVTSGSPPVAPSAPDSAPSGAVGGVQSPAEAGSTLNLLIDASDGGAGLASAQASIGPNSASVSLCPSPVPAGGQSRSECPESVSDVSLSIGVGVEGAQRLLVTVTDTAGKTATLVDQTVDVVSPPSPGSNTVTLGLAGGFPGPPGPPSEPPGPEYPEYKEPPSTRPPVCHSPMLEMRLSSRPLRYTSQSVPVLLAGHRGLFTGKLTCLNGSRRAAAPDGTPVGVLYHHSACVLNRSVCASSSRERTAAVRKGRLNIHLLIVGPGTVRFRYRPREDESVQVSLAVAVAQKHSHGRARKHKHKHRRHAPSHGRRHRRGHAHVHWKKHSSHARRHRSRRRG